LSGFLALHLKNGSEGGKIAPTGKKNCRKQRRTCLSEAKANEKGRGEDPSVS